MESQNFGHHLKECRMCASKNLHMFLDLGFHPPSDAILTPDDINSYEIMFPLRLVQCESCGLTQLDYVVNPEVLYGRNYLYESSMTDTGKKHFYDMADSLCSQFHLPRDSLVVDIGSNVGVLLEGFKKNGMSVLGIDPAPRISNIANQRGIETWQEFMTERVAQKIIAEKKRASLVTGTNVFAHIDDKNGLMIAVSTLLEEDGIFVIEAPYLVDLIDNLEYDTVYLEHLEYLSIRPLVNFFHKYGMEIFRVEKYEIHGSSLRILVSKKGKRQIEKSVGDFIALEEAKKIYSKETLSSFAQRVRSHREELKNLLIGLKKEGKKIVGISAPAKGNTLLNYCKIDTDLIDYITEKSVIKRGNYTPGMHIPIVSEEKLYDDKPHYGLILAWNFSEEIMKNNEEFKKEGGTFIIPIPRVHTL